MTLHITFLAVYSAALMILGLWIGRRVRSALDFFVAGRTLGPGLIFSTMLAANIGAGSTVGATSRGYSEGLAASWWVGSAAIGSLVLAFWIGPRIWRIAARHGLRTVGDYLEHRYNRTVRGAVAVVLWLGSLFILASQLIGLGWILNVVLDVPKPLGCAIGGAVITVYFAAGGLLTAAWVNVVQLSVKLGGFALAVPLAISAAGGLEAIRSVPASPGYWSLWKPDISIGYLTLLAPAFIVSPGLIQKIFGARDERAVRVGVGLNAIGLFAYAGVPALLGIIARQRFPDLPTTNLALPMILTHGLPPLAGALAIAAVFSAEVSAADASLFMLTTSLSEDLYKQFVNPDATDERLLVVVRWTTIASGLVGVGLSIASEDVIDTLTVFYTLLVVSLFVPLVGGLYVRRTSSRGAMMSIACGVGTTALVHVSTAGAGWPPVTPALAGLAASIGAWAASLAFDVG